jgi:hypothetical protein
MNKGRLTTAPCSKRYKKESRLETEVVLKNVDPNSSQIAQ